jgi:hypothetical protein
METSRIAVPAAPAANAAVTLYDSTLVHGPKQMRAQNVSQVIVSFLNISHASATNGLVATQSSDGGTNWDQAVFANPTSGTATMPCTVPASSAGVDGGYSFDVHEFDDFKLVFTLSNNTLTAWRVIVSVVYGAPVLT